ncbi:methyltransferase [Amycolatopsis sp. cg13]|uniref:methyltransferase n=1 Tax=Amycolatopsis sp. cg13 TaxID=3238807 RepID=UPI0035247434
MPESDGVAAPLRLHALAYSLGVTAALSAVVRLGVADALSDQPRPVAELAVDAGADAGALRQLLRALAVRGVFADVGGDRYEHTELSRLLRSGETGGKRDMVLLASAPFAWRTWASLDEAVRSGESVFPKLYGKTLFEYLAEDDPESGAVFEQAMARSGRLIADSVTEALDLSGAAHVADVGGGRGHLLKALLEHNPSVRGTLFDLPQVIANVDPGLRDDPRCAVVAGDATEAVPVHADVYLLKHVIHMWDDTTAVRALRAVAAAAPSGARIVVAEQLLDDGPALEVTTTMSLLMLVTQGGRERTGAELRALLAAAGLRFVGITLTKSQVRLVEAVVA